MNNATFFTADRNTHIKIVTVALAASTVVFIATAIRAIPASSGSHVRAGSSIVVAGE